jgi:hypothetical protein
VLVDGGEEEQRGCGYSEEGFGGGGGGDWESGPIQAYSGWRKRLGEMQVKVTQEGWYCCTSNSASEQASHRLIIDTRRNEK